MSARTLSITDSLHAYLLSVHPPLPDLFLRQRAETAALPNGGMQISVEQGYFMEFLIQLLRPQKVLEIGVFTGYSGLVVASALPAESKLIACDVSEEWTSIARRYWEEAGVTHKIDLRIAPALQTLDQLIEEGEAGTFDFAFIDADKGNYDAYYERSLELVRTGGVIGIDNTLWYGKVADHAVQDADTVALRKLNEKLRDDPRVTVSLLPIGDGLTLALKR